MHGEGVGPCYCHDPCLLVGLDKRMEATIEGLLGHPTYGCERGA